MKNTKLSFRLFFFADKVHVDTQCYIALMLCDDIKELTMMMGSATLGGDSKARMFQHLRLQ